MAGMQQMMPATSAQPANPKALVKQPAANTTPSYPMGSPVQTDAGARWTDPAAAADKAPG